MQLLKDSAGSGQVDADELRTILGRIAPDVEWDGATWDRLTLLAAALARNPAVAQARAPAALILAGAPLALTGGAAAVAHTGGVLSLRGLVGFVTLFGITARNAILLLAHVDHLVANEGCDFSIATVVRATSERVAPILMTAFVTGLGMAPLAFGSGEAGREVQGPMAAVILGGLAISTVLSLILLPPLVVTWRHPRERPAARPASVST
jgi:Cu/Ag efflux pump CusA